LGYVKPYAAGADHPKVRQQVNSLSRIVRILLWSVFAGWAMWLLRRLVLSAAGAQAAPFPRPSPVVPVHLHRDPFCGTYVAPEISFTGALAGEIEHFCSAECRDNYVGSMRRASSA
jgi:hypothetical protein